MISVIKLSCKPPTSSLLWLSVSHVAYGYGVELPLTHPHSARKECLEPLINLQVHGLLLASVQEIVQTLFRSEHLDQSETLDHYQRLLQAIRALKSLSVAIVGLTDPYGARAAMSELVLASAHARAKALGLSVPTSAARSEQPPPSAAAGKRSPGGTMIASQRSIATTAEQMFSVRCPT